MSKNNIKGLIITGLSHIHVLSIIPTFGLVWEVFYVYIWYTLRWIQVTVLKPFWIFVILGDHRDSLLVFVFYNTCTFLIHFII